MNHHLKGLLLGASLVSFGASLAFGLDDEPSPVSVQSVQSFSDRTGRPSSSFGDPVPGLTAAQLADFLRGQLQFETAEEPDEGLGPTFNDVSCVACHSVPVTGGSSALLETRYGRSVNGVFDPLAAEGGSLLQLKAIAPAVQEVLPPDANVVAKRRTTALFGLGLIEAIPDSLIIQNSRRNNPDGVTGRVCIVEDVVSGTQRVGRFGWKAQQTTILAFSGDAYLNEMGVTSRLFPQENAPNGNTALLALFDLVPDPEDKPDPVTGKADIDVFADYMRFLGPPPSLPLSRSAQVGKSLFSQIGCAVCHTPTLFTASNSVAALSLKPVNLYSDLLLHDMGSLGDGIAQGNARPREMKTAPLWGLRAVPVFLHDGRAATVDEAIRDHDGEASTARNRYRRLSPAQRQTIVDFLNSI